MVQFILKSHSDLFPTEEIPLLLMASRGSQYLFLFFLSLVCCSFSISAEKLRGGNELVFHASRRELFYSFHYKATRHDMVTPPVTYPPTPVTNPVTTPTIVPPVVTVPATNPIGATPNPVPVPTPIPPATPVPVPGTNPVTPTVPVTNPVTTPVTNPVTPPGTLPVTPPGAVPLTPPGANPTPVPVTPNAPATPGQSWCVAKGGIQDATLQSALDYACGIGGADCSTIQQGGTCYNPNTLQNHASVAFNNYYQKNPSQTSCDFGGTAMTTNVNPSVGSCVFATLSSSTASPGTPVPATATSSGATPVSYGNPPTVLNASNPAPGSTTTGFGDGPSSSSASTSTSYHFQPTIGCILLFLTTTIAWIMVF